VTVRKEEKPPKTTQTQARPVQNHIVSTNQLLSAKKLQQMAKEKSVENLIDDDEFDSTPGMDERGNDN
jgi:hypothetical protein